MDVGKLEIAGDEFSPVATPQGPPDLDIDVRVDEMSRPVGRAQVETAGVSAGGGCGSTVFIDGRIAAASRTTPRVGRHDVVIASADEASEDPVSF